MRLAISTALAVCVVDCEKRTLFPCKAPGKPEFYGISATPESVIFGNSRIDTAALTDHDAFRQSPRGHLAIRQASGLTRSAAELLQPHQIECHGNHVICANSGLNCITVFAPDLTVRHHHPVQAHFDILPGGRKGNHFNSVHVSGEIVHVLAHNYDRLSTIWLFTWPEFQLINVLATGAEWAHNVMVSGDDWWICNSRAGALYSVREKRDIWKLEDEGDGVFITRGLAATESLLFVGLTTVAPRWDRKTCDAGLCVLDRQSLRVIHRFRFPGIGGIHEVRLLDQPDACHGGSVIPGAVLLAAPEACADPS